MYNVLQPREDIHRLNVSRKEAGRGLTSIGNYDDATITVFGKCSKKRKERIIATNNSIIVNLNLNNKRKNLKDTNGK